MTPKRREEDNQVLSYKTVAMTMCGIVLSLISHAYLVGVGGNTTDIKEIKKNTEIIPVFAAKMEEMRRDIDKNSKDISLLNSHTHAIDIELALLKKKYEDLRMEVQKINSTVNR